MYPIVFFSTVTEQSFADDFKAAEFATHVVVITGIGLNMRNPLALPDIPHHPEIEISRAIGIFQLKQSN